jgi:hypothetical protein
MLVDISGDLGWWCVVKQRIEEKIWCDLVHWLLSCRLACRCSKQYGLILPLVQLLCQICVAHVRTYSPPSFLRPCGWRASATDMHARTGPGRDSPSAAPCTTA